MDLKKRYRIVSLTEPYLQGFYRRKSIMSEVFSLNVAHFKMLHSVPYSGNNRLCLAVIGSGVYICDWLRLGFIACAGQ